ncbi:MAG: zinc-dependent metalloprotease [Myxococcota bacterium]
MHNRMNNQAAFSGAWLRRALGLTLAASLLGTGCFVQTPNDDINRVQKPYLPKKWFNDGKSWYLRRTVVDAPAQAEFNAIGWGDWPTVERLRWEVREDILIGYKDYEIVPGSETAEQPGADFKGTPAVLFPIKEHFDIARSYNQVTGEQTNVIGKNMERPWFEREYFVVDWGAPLVQNVAMGEFFSSPAGDYWVQEHEVTNPDRARFSQDYLEFTIRMDHDFDIYACLGGLDWAKVPDCAAGVTDVRWSFSRVNEEEDFEVTPYPDSVNLVDASGDYVRDGTQQAIRVPIFEKFGFFRLERLTYDRDRGVTDSGRILRAFKFNLWKKSFRDDGTAIPYAEREPKPIVYYMNSEVPEDQFTEGDNVSEFLKGLSIKQANREIGEDYNKVFRELVAVLQGKCKDASGAQSSAVGCIPDDSVPAMFEVRENDCNFNNLKSFVQGNGLESSLDREPINGLGGLEDRRNEVARACQEDPMGRTCSQKRQHWSHLLKQACTVVESATENAGEGEARFTWQRLGDVRYSFVHLTDHLQSVGWLGLGMLAADPITGEIRNSFAYVDGPGTDLSATNAADMVDAMNDDILMSDLVFGENIRNFITEKNAQVGAKLRGYPTQSEIANIERRFARAGRTPEELLPEGGSTAAQHNKLAQIAGTPLENLVLNDQDLMLAAKQPLDAVSQVSDDLLSKASMARGGGVVALKEKFRERMQQAMGGKDAPCRYMREFIDDAILGLALDLKDKSRVERWAYLRFMIYKTVMLHEVGHTLGLRHNFQGTWDALNFTNRFYDLIQTYSYVPTATAQNPEPERVGLALEDGLDLANGLANAAAEGSQEKLQRQAEAAMLDNCIAKVGEDEDRYVNGCAGLDCNDRDNAGNADCNTCRDNIPWARSQGLVIQLDSLQCLRADEGKSSSVMDYHGKFHGRFGGLGKYDAAALKFGYAQVVEEFEDDALQGVSSTSSASTVKDWLWEHDYKKIAFELGQPAGSGRPNGVLRRVNKLKPWKATQTTWAPSALEVPYGFCSDEYAYYGALGGTDVCRIRDWGANHREQMEHDLLRYKQYYFFTQFARNRLTWDIGAAIQSNMDVFDKILLTFQYMFFYRAYGPNFFETDLGKDFLKASQAGLDLYAEVLGQPEMGDFLETAGAHGFTRNSRVRGRWLKSTTEDWLDLDPTTINQADNTGSGVAVPIYYYGQCEFGAAYYGCGPATNGPQGQYPGFICTGNQCVMNVALGDGRPSFLNFTNDYEDWFFTYVGNYFDKANLLFNLVDAQAYFPRLSEEGSPNVRVLRIGVSSLFGDNIRRLVYSVITNRPDVYGSLYRNDTGFTPRNFGSLNPEDQAIQQGDVLLLPRRITNLPYQALLLGMALQSSLDDSILDFSSVAQIGVKGEEDDIQTWDTLPADQKVEFTHPISGVTYRAAKVGDYPVAFDLVSNARRLSEKYVGYNDCVVNPPNRTDATVDARPACQCTYLGAFRTEDKNNDGSISGTGSGATDDECVMLRPEDNLSPCEERVEECEGVDSVDLRDQAFERMEAQVELIENVRAFYQIFGYQNRL